MVIYQNTTCIQGWSWRRPRLPKFAPRPETQWLSGLPLFHPYVRKTKSLEAALPWLYLKGLSSGEMGETLKVLIGPEARRLFRDSPVTMLDAQNDERPQLLTQIRPRVKSKVYCITSGRQRQKRMLRRPSNYLSKCMNQNTQRLKFVCKRTVMRCCTWCSNLDSVRKKNGNDCADTTTWPRW